MKSGNSGKTLFERVRDHDDIRHEVFAQLTLHSKLAVRAANREFRAQIPIKVVEPDAEKVDFFLKFTETHRCDEYDRRRDFFTKRSFQLVPESSIAELSIGDRISRRLQPLPQTQAMIKTLSTLASRATGFLEEPNDLAASHYFNRAAARFVRGLGELSGSVFYHNDELIGPLGRWSCAELGQWARPKMSMAKRAHVLPNMMPVLMDPTDLLHTGVYRNIEDYGWRWNLGPTAAEPVYTGATAALVPRAVGQAALKFGASETQVVDFYRKVLSTTRRALLERANPGLIDMFGLFAPRWGRGTDADQKRDKDLFLQAFALVLTAGYPQAQETAPVPTAQ